MEETFKSFQYPLLILTTLGFCSGRKQWRKRAVGMIFIVLVSFNLCMVAVQCRYMEHNILEVVTALEAACIFGQQFGKYGALVCNYNAFVALIQHTKDCWKTNRCSGQLQKDLHRLLKYNLIVQKCYLLASIICVSIRIAVAPWDNGLPLGVWKMEGHNVMYLVIYVAQSSTLLVASLFLAAFDCLYLACCIELIVQCRILTQNMKELDLSRVCNKQTHSEYFNMLTFYVQHHNFVLRFVKSMQNFYSPVAIVEYCTVSPFMCSVMYAIFDRMDVQTFVSCGPLFFTGIMQLAFYSILADHVASEATQVAYSFYESNWYLRNFPKLRKPLILVILQSNQRVAFTAGGFFEVNARSLLTALKVSWSACTVLRAVKQMR